jgi:hypothetical protein
VHDASGWEVVLRCAIGVLVAVIVGLVVTVLVRRLLLRVGLDATALARPRRSPIVALFVVIALRAVLGASTDRGEDGHGLLHLLDIAIIAVVAWLLIEAATIVERAWLEKYPAQGEANLRQRHARTQILLLRRVTVAMIATVAIGAMLWTIPAVRELGAGILASAGVLGIVAGLAAQTSLGNIFACTRSRSPTPSASATSSRSTTCGGGLTYVVRDLPDLAVHLLQHDAVPELDAWRHAELGDDRARRQLEGAAGRPPRGAAPLPRDV